MDDDGDEYDAYNLSEFSAADFVYIDGTARQHVYDATAQGARTSPVVTSESGGPKIAVVLELAADESVVVKAAAGRSGSAEVEIVDAAQGLGERLRKKAERNGPHRTRHRLDLLSPFEMYRSRGTLSVSDLVGPAWCVLIIRCCYSRMTEHCSPQRCEVQFDYGLRQGRSLALAKRPESFVSAEGKVIKVEKKVAQVNEKVQGRGRVSVPISSTFMFPHVLLLVCSQGIGT
jgi:exonuclease V